MLHKHHHRGSLFYITSQSGDLWCWFQQAALKETLLLLLHLSVGRVKKNIKKKKKKDNPIQWQEKPKKITASFYRIKKKKKKKRTSYFSSVGQLKSPSVSLLSILLQKLSCGCNTAGGFSGAGDSYPPSSSLLLKKSLLPSLVQWHQWDGCPTREGSECDPPVIAIAVHLEIVFSYSVEIDYGVLKEESPKAQYNWYFHWQVLKKPRNDSVWNLAPFLLPGQIFLHIWVKIH